MTRGVTGKQKAQSRDSVATISRELDRHLAAIRQRLRQPLEAEFARGNLTAPQRVVMKVLVESGDMSLKQLSREVNLAHSTVSGIVDRLEFRGMVTRTTDSTDGRVSRIAVSKAVREFLRNRAQELVLHPLEEALTRAGEGERNVILRGVRKLRKLVDAS